VTAREPSARAQHIEARLRGAFGPEHLEIEDESHRHRGHAGAADGRGHFRVRIVSPAFAGRSRVERHRMLYDALREELVTDIHALAIEAWTPEEFAARG
jgi:BolA protein